jgi:hypothetical protein
MEMFTAEEAWHIKYERFNLSGGQAHDLSSALAAVSSIYIR